MALTQEAKNMINGAISSVVAGCEIAPDKHLNNDIGADSLDEVEIVMALEDEFDVEISDAELETMPGRTVQDIYTNMESKLQGTKYLEK